MSRQTPAHSELQLGPGMTLGCYTVVRRIGAGGMSSVFEAVHADLGKRVAIKALLPHMALDEESRMRFLREGRAASRIRHPNIVDIYDVGTQGDVVFLVMEFLEGHDLSSELIIQSPMPVVSVSDLLLPVCGAIQAAHVEGVIHRDLKPANIFLSAGRNGNVVPMVLDFGISKLLSSGSDQLITGVGTLLGTPVYMSPEHVEGSQDNDPRSDQYSLGVILYECTVGRRPFEGPPSIELLSRIANGQFAPPRAVNRDLPVEFEEIIVKAMSRAPAARFASVRELGAALLPFASERAQAVWSAEFRATERLRRDPMGSTAPALATRLESSLAAADTASPLHASSRDNDATLVSATRERLSNSGEVEEVDAGRLGMAAGIAFLVTVIIAFAYFISRTQLDEASVVVVSEARIVEPPVPSQAPLDPTALSVTTVAIPNAAQGEPDGNRAAMEKTFSVSVRTNPSDAIIELDGKRVGTGLFARALPQDGRAHVLHVTREGHENWSVTFVDSPPPGEITLKPLAAASPARSEPGGRPQSETGGAGGSQRRDQASTLGPSSKPKPAIDSAAPNKSDSRPGHTNEKATIDEAGGTARGANRAPILD